MSDAVQKAIKAREDAKAPKKAKKTATKKTEPKEA